MNWSWVNETAYDDDGMKHLVERVVQSSHQMHASDPFEDHEPTEIKSVLVIYSKSGEFAVRYASPELVLFMPVPTKLWADLESLSLFYGSEDLTVPSDTMQTIAGATLQEITNSMAIFRTLLKLYTAAIKANDNTAWEKDVTAPCKITIHKEAI